MHTASKFAKMVGVTVKTLQRWDRTKRLVALRTHTNRRYYTDEMLSKVLSPPAEHSATPSAGGLPEPK